MPSYDPQNIFAKILRGELPCYKVYEDDKVLAFLDIMPRAPGHTLVLPKSSARNLLDVEPDDLAAVARAAQKIAKAAMNAFSADGITIQQFNEGAGGQVVFHLHVHVIPRKAGVPMKPPASEKEKPDVLSDQALKLAAALKGLNLGPEEIRPEQDRGFAGQHAGKHRAFGDQEGNEAEHGRADPHPNRDRRQRARGRQDKLRQHGGQQRRRHRPHPDDELRFLVEAMHQHQPDQPPHLVRQEAEQDERQHRPQILQGGVQRGAHDACFRLASRSRWTT